MARGDELALSKEKYWREQIAAIVDAERLKALGEPSPSDTAFALVVIWVEIAVLLCAANLLPRLPLPWAVVCGVVLVPLIGTRVNALGVMIHEGSHGCLAGSRKRNDQVTNWGAAFWTINSVEEYRPTHRLHHRYLGSERDPDRPAYLVPARRGALAGRVLQDLAGITAFRRATTLVSGASTEDGAPGGLLSRPVLLVGKAVTQLVVLGQFMVFQGVLWGIVFYVAFWLVPIVCIYPMTQRLKNIAEHFDPALRDPRVVRWVARTSVAGILQNHLLGARMEYHFEHHVLPTIPYQGLRKLHRSLDKAGLFADHKEFLSGGYVQFLARAASHNFEIAEDPAAA